MDLLGAVVAWAGPLIVVGAWLAVRRGRVSIWVAMAAAAGPLGVLSLVAGVRVEGELGAAVEAGVGIGAGLTLYGATAAFMYLARGWSVLARHTGEVYAWREGLPLWAALVLASLVVAPGEELLWRGLVQGRFSGLLSEAAAAAAAWGAYVAVNAAAGSLPILLGAAVGGAAWGALALWTDGVVASILCHVVWTGLMVAAPPVFRREGGA